MASAKTSAAQRAVAKVIRESNILMTSYYDANNGVMGIDGMRGDTGVSGHPGHKGPPGEPGIPMEKYILCYAGLPFEIWLKPTTFEMIEDSTQVTGDELEFIKVIDQKEWEKIREMWCAEWHKRRGYKAFQMGLYEEFEAGVVL